MVPNGWITKQVKDICSQVSVGIVIKPAQYYVDKDQGVRAFRSANVREGRVGNGDWVYLSHEGNVKNSKSQLKTGDVLVVRSGYPGTACVLPEEYEGSNCIDIIFARPRKSVAIPEYLCAFTNSEQGKKQVLNTQGGLAQKHLNVDAYGKMRIPLPPLPEQMKIAQILSTWDKAIETVDKLIKNSKQQKQALMQQLLTGKKRESVLLGRFCEKVGSGVTPRGGSEVYKTSGVPLIRSQNVLLGNLDLQDVVFIDEKTHQNMSNSHVRQGDVLLNITGASIGRACVVPEIHSEANVNQHVCIIRTKKSINPVFLCEYLLSFEGQKQIERFQAGGNRQGLNFQQIRAFKLPSASVDEQNKIEQLSYAANTTIEYLNRLLLNIKVQKNSLMQQLLTGKRRVKV